MTLLVGMFDLVFAHLAFCVSFDDIKDLLPDVDGSNALVQQMIQEESDRLGTRLTVIHQASFEAETKSLMNYQRMIRRNQKISELVNLTEQEIKNWENANKELDGVVADYNSAKEVERSNIVKVAKARYREELRQKMNQVLEDLTTHVQSSLAPLHTTCVEADAAFEEITGNLCAAWKRVVEETDRTLVGQVNRNVQRLGGSSSSRVREIGPNSAR